MARRLIEAGHDVSVWNRTQAKALPLVEIGARPSDSPADAARGAEVVITMMADPDALATVSEGEGGITEGLDVSSTVIEMSTVGPDAIVRLRGVLPPESGLLDAPVLGSLTEAESGVLKIFVGGPDPLVARWTGLLSDMGVPLHVGPLGSGAAAKLVANSTLLGTLGLLGEALALGRALGLPSDVVFDVLANTPIAPQAERRRPQIESRDDTVRFTLSLAQKDADLISGAATSAGLKLRLIAAARSWLADAVAAGDGDKDYSVVLTHILESVNADPGVSRESEG